jgi:hypothetical protein
MLQYVEEQYRKIYIISKSSFSFNVIAVKEFPSKFIVSIFYIFPLNITDNVWVLNISVL